jgi:hypothetical protein
MDPNTVAIMYPHAGSVAQLFHKSLHDLQVHDRERGLNLLRHELSMRSGANISRARNMLVQELLRTDCEWGWFCDTDMVFQPDTLVRLLAAAKAADTRIVGALCVVVNEGVLTNPRALIPTLFVDDPDTITKVSHNYPDDTVVEVAATGTGCLLVHRSVFEDIRAAAGDDWSWFRDLAEECPDGETRWIGEDIRFCLQARSLGHRVYVDCTTPVGHWKGHQVWWPADVRRIDPDLGPAVLEADIERRPVELAVEPPMAEVRG